jgi:L-ascorbate metabolism protein UlaG (beta-lactamase superfamily)
MNITKIGHCCLLVKLQGITILTDPGNYTEEQDSLTGVNIILITHEHADHFHVESVEKILVNNPNATILCNSGVGAILEKLGIGHTLLEGDSTISIAGLAITACEGMHEEIFEEMGQVQNTGYLINEDLFLPGDSFHVPSFQVKTLALPVAGPWCKIPDSLRFAIALKPEQAFPIHDAGIKEGSLGFTYTVTKNALAQHGVEFVPLMTGDSVDL